MLVEGPGWSARLFCESTEYHSGARLAPTPLREYPPRRCGKQRQCERVAGAARRPAHRGGPDRPDRRVERHPRRALPLVVPGHEPAVFHRGVGHPRDTRGAVVRPSSGAVRPRPPRSRRPGPERSPVLRGMDTARLAASGRVGPSLSPHLRPGRHRHLGLLVAPQRAVRPPLGEAAPGEGGRGRDLRRSRGRRRRRASRGPSAPGCAAPHPGDRGRGLHRRRHRRGTRDARPARSQGAGGREQRMGRDPAHAPSPRSGARDRPRRRRSPRSSTTSSRRRPSPTSGRASHWCASSASSTPGPVWPRS